MKTVSISSEALKRLTFPTYSSSRYCDVDRLPADLQEIIKNAESERECSRYTVYTETLFIRGEFLTSDDVSFSFEICIGEIPCPTDDEGNEISDDECEDSDAHYDCMADEMLAVAELENLSVYFEEIIKRPLFSLGDVS